MNAQEIERALITRYRAKLYRPFIRAIQEYELIQEGDYIGVCISGGKDSFLLAKLLQHLQKHSKFPFSVKYLVMNPGYTQESLQLIKENANKLGLDIIIKDSNIFEIAQKMSEKPCYLCARMRRGFLYQFAKEQGCNKIALGHHFDDVIETVLLNIFYSGRFKSMVPKLRSENFEGMELIRPLVFVRERDIINFMKNCEITALSCGCIVEQVKVDSKRRKIKALIAKLREIDKNIEINIYKSTENVNLDRLLGYKLNNKKHTFLELYNQIEE